MDVFNGDPKPLYYHQRTVPDPEAAPDEWNVDKILDDRKRDGKLEFLTKWEGYGAEEAVWEPIGNFFQRLNSEAAFGRDKTPLRKFTVGQFLLCSGRHFQAMSLMCSSLTLRASVFGF